MLDNFPYSAPVPHQSHRSHLPRKFALGALLLALVPVWLQVTVPSLAPRATASAGLLCVGFDQCNAGGMSASGYHSHWQHMYWNMYAGVNCVNYTAYRMVEAGMPDVRPWTGSGNAENWGHAMSSITDQTPRVGSVAWWDGGAPGASAKGHVAYVEKVISPTEIVVSESNWGSEFDWRDISIDHDWPSGFIHFVDHTLKETSAPTMSGTPTVGANVKVSTGRWSPSASFTYQWMIDGAPIKGKTQATYMPGKAAYGHQVTVRVTASAAKYAPTSVVVNAPAATAAGTLNQTVAPTVVGDAIVGQTLRVTRPTFRPLPTTLTQQWFANGAAIPGATGTTLPVTADLLGKQIAAKVIATRPAFNTAAVWSPSTATVQYPQIASDAAGSVSGTAARGDVLTADPGTFKDPYSSDPVDATLTYQWMLDGQPITGATKSTYSLTRTDVGDHRISVAVTASADDYRPLTQTYAVSGPITTQSTLKMDAKGGVRSAIIQVRVSALGITGKDVTGSLTVRVGKDVQTVKLTGSYARIKVDDINAGPRQVVITYGGSRLIAGSHMSGSVTVLPQKPTKKPTHKK
jgi:surface antigen